MLPNDESSRLVVDEDWKQQVEREKEELRRKEIPGDKAGDEADAPFPTPPSLEVLISMLANQALSALGILPNPESGKPEVNRSAAKFFIDLLGELEKKTKGNLSDTESDHINTALHHLRMVFVSELPVEQNRSNKSKSESIIELP